MSLPGRSTRSAAARAVRCCLVMCIASVATGVGAQELTTPGGTYRHCTFHVSGTVEDIGQVASQPGMEGEVHLAFRDGRCGHAYMVLRGPLEYHGILELIPDSLELTGDRLRGSLRADFPVGRPSPGTLAVDLAVKDGGFSGEYHWGFKYPIIGGSIANEFVGHVEGTIRSAEDIRRMNALAAGKAWPSWPGPTAGMSAPDPGAELVDSLWEARPVWVSETEILAGRGGEKEGGGHPYGGYASPIVADGKVFLNQWAPSGNAVADRSNKTTDRRVDADDVVFCFDAATGQLLWKQVFPAAGLNQASANKHVYWNNTGCWDNGKVYMLGFTWRVYCLDAETGRLIWRSHIGPAHEELERAKAEALKSRTMLSPPDTNKFLAVAQGVPLMYNLEGGIIAFDPETGQPLWTVPGSPVVSRWQNGGKAYIITERRVEGRDHALCLVPETGEPLWTSPIEGAIVPLSITPDYLATHTAAEKKDVLRIYRIDRTGASEQATIALPGSLVGWQCALGNDLFITVRTGNQDHQATRDRGVIARIDLQAGRIAASTAWSRVTWSNAMFAWADRLVFLDDMAHATSPLNMYSADRLEPMGPPLWRQLHLATSAYDAPMAIPYVDGRLFFRGMKRIVCYDLRAGP